MVLQARAEATRRKILESAVDLFDELGYGETGLADVLQRAGVSKGAFYYHFDSKEAVATAIIEEYTRRSKDAMRARLVASQPLLDQMIVSTFVAAEMLEADKACRIGNELLQALGQVSSVATRIYATWSEEFVGGLTKGIEAAGGFERAHAAEVAETMWAGVVGCHLLSSALQDDAHARLARTWRSMIRAIAPDQLPHYSDLIDRTAQGVQAVAS